jgi:bifunctional DNase/RNase
MMDQYVHEQFIGEGKRLTLPRATSFDIELVFISEIHEEQVIYLREVGGPTCLPVVTGIFEAYSIALRLQGFQSPRPLTFDAMLSAIAALGGKMYDVLIDKIDGTTYFAKARVNQAGKLVVIDMRPSDAFNLAITSNSPIFFTNELVNKMAIRAPIWPTK